MDLNDYLIDQSGHDWSAILSEWHWLLPSDLTVWMVNKFGDVIFVPDDRAVYLLDIGGGTTQQLANSRDDFCEQVDLDDNANNWLLISLTDQCVDAGLRLEPGQCYGFKIPPVLGGEYAVDNIEIRDLAVNSSLLAQIHLQIKDLPDGSKVNLVLRD